MFALDLIENLAIYKVQTLSRFYKSLKEGFNNYHDGPLILLCMVNCLAVLLNFVLLRYIRFAHIIGDKRILPDNSQHEMLNQLNLVK